MFEWEILMGPIVGGAIGYITNSIAIKMLFRPLNPVVIFGKTLPFTPGMIPKEQQRIGHEAGQLIEKELIDLSILKSRLLGAEIYSGIEAAIKAVLAEASTSAITLDEYLVNNLKIDQLDYYKAVTIKKLSQLVANSIKNSNLGETIINEVLNIIKDSIGPFKMFIGDAFIDNISTKGKEIVNQIIEERIYDYVFTMISAEADKFFDTSVGELTDSISEYEDFVINIVSNAYTNFIENQLAAVLKKINLSGIIEEKIVSYSPKKLEEMILAVVKKELNAIVYLGVLLGAIMGCLM
ncbi:DUF445 domain-containing protein [Candidatus Epulonipiscium viviparus]|uniref:DUF445 domain-containing protein n=1 Tax=Candidatus Epulonipiscium viviparus TaxID=420336 RepID=UPI0027380D45|nr:DUF445 family protein [Candidatus Epulopiscium viviparus]